MDTRIIEKKVNEKIILRYLKRRMNNGTIHTVVNEDGYTGKII